MLLSGGPRRKVGKLVAGCHSAKEIAETPFISVKTVQRHRAKHVAELGMRDRLAFTRFSIRARTGPAMRRLLSDDSLGAGKEEGVGAAV